MTQKFVNGLDLTKMQHCAMPSRVMPTLHKSPRAGESVKVYFHSVGRCQPSILKVNPFLTQNALF